MQPGEAGQAVKVSLQQGIHHTILCQHVVSKWSIGTRMCVQVHMHVNQ